jgi:hypothetical protein
VVQILSGLHLIAIGTAKLLMLCSHCLQRALASSVLMSYDASGAAQSMPAQRLELLLHLLRLLQVLELAELCGCPPEAAALWELAAEDNYREQVCGGGGGWGGGGRATGAS